MISLIPYFLAFLAVSCYALLAPIAKKVGLHLPPFTFIAISSGIIALGSGIIGFFLERDKVSAAMHDINWGWLFIFSAINMVGYVFYLMAIRKIPIAQYEMFGILMPIIGGLFALILLKEPFHLRYILALAFMAVGIAIAVGPDLRSK